MSTPPPRTDPPKPHPSGSASERAEAVFASWALRAEAGRAEDFADFLAAQAELAVELERLHADWRLFAPILGQVVPGPIAEESGIAMPSLSSGPDGEFEPPSDELLQRLGIHVPERGRYRFRGLLGRGGGGVVIKVWDTKLKRALAMKVVLGRDEEGPGGETPRVDGRTLSRFVDEARIASQLNHPGIVPVHELGADESGRAFFTMRLVRGEDLGRIFAHVRTGQGGWNLPRALGVLLRACEAMAYAHDKGVIHRDLKPANVMVGRYGEVHVMDWGLARVLGEPDRRDLRIRPAPAVPSSMVDSLRRAERAESPGSPLVTLDGSVIGTPSYMAPEQAKGRLTEIGVQADVYALGAMLYHLLTGQAPYAPPDARISPHAILAAAIQGPPPAVGGLEPTAPPELVAICEKAMERELPRRYASVEALAADLRAYLEGRVVGAYESGAVAVVRKWVKRNRVLTSASLGLLLLAGALALVLGVHRGTATRLARIEQQNRLILWVLHFVTFGGLLDEAQVLWPAVPERFPRFEDWLGRVRSARERAGSVHEEIDRLQRITDRSEVENHLLSFLMRVEPDFESLERGTKPIAAVFARAKRAAELSRQEDVRLAWTDAIALIAASRKYGGLQIESQFGLLPLREDPRSGLWEFWHVLSGEKPELDPDTDRWRIEEATGVVLVLIPGGEYVLGASEGDPYVRHFEDRKRDMPPQPVRLTPYFLSKYELTRAQWERAGAVNESRDLGPTDPVERVSWERASEILPRLDLELPTEAQWEAAARGGTRTRFYTGDEPQSLFGHVVILPDLDGNDQPDRDSSGEILPQYGQVWRGRHEPVGGRDPNPFGLHDVVGNVSEWCRDDATTDPSIPMRDGDGLREPGSDTVLGVLRGGNYLSSWPAARHSHRFPWAKANRENDTGLRPARGLR